MLVAVDLAPADTATLDPATVLAIVTERGGPTGCRPPARRQQPRRPERPVKLSPGGYLGSPTGSAAGFGLRALILDPPTAGLDELLARRRHSGLDRLDEVWQGVLHLVPAPGEAYARITQQLAELLGPLARGGLIPTRGELNLGVRARLSRP